MSRFELPKNPEFYNYESPITKAVKEIEEELMKQEEHLCMMTVSREVGYSVDKDELIKTLNYDREQYDKGYRDGAREAFYDKTEAEGLLCFSENFTQTHVRVGYFYIPEYLKGIICFKVSHVRKVVEL